jgi:hypothetical protein
VSLPETIDAAWLEPELRADRAPAMNGGWVPALDAASAPR